MSSAAAAAQALVARLDTALAALAADVDALRGAAARPQVAVLERSLQAQLAAANALELSDAVLDVPRQAGAAALRSDLDARRDTLLRLQSEYRVAVLAAYKAANAAAVEERNELLRSRKPAKPVDASNEALIRASNDITQGLEEAVKMMSAQVELSTETVRALEQSTATMSKTQAEYNVIADLLGASRLILRDLTNLDVKDRIILTIGLIIFLSTVVYVIGRRIWIPGYAWATGQCKHSTAWICF
nr:hypothetical protein HK105_002946 [Polyrhizophydium stewartii]